MTQSNYNPLITPKNQTQQKFYDMKATYLMPEKKADDIHISKNLNLGLQPKRNVIMQSQPNSATKEPKSPIKTNNIELKKSIIIPGNTLIRKSDNGGECFNNPAYRDTMFDEKNRVKQDNFFKDDENLCLNNVTIGPNNDNSEVDGDKSNMFQNPYFDTKKDANVDRHFDNEKRHNAMEKSPIKTVYPDSAEPMMKKSYIGNNFYTDYYKQNKNQ